MLPIEHDWTPKFDHFAAQFFEGIGLVLVTLNCRRTALRPVQVIEPDELLRRARKDLVHAMRPAVEAWSRGVLGS
jgi:hypothetical protein